MRKHTTGVPLDLLKIASSGDHKAQYSVGWHYETGTKVPVDLNEAEKWWVKSAAGGNASAKLGLGNIAYKRKDLAQAEKWWLESATAGDTAAKRGLALLARKRGNLVQAKEWLLNAALAGDAIAQHQLVFFIVRLLECQNRLNG